VSQRNGSKPGARALMRAVSRLLREQRDSLDEWLGR